MPRFQVEDLTFDFNDDWQVVKYDDDTFHIKHFQGFAGGSKAVDLVAFGNGELWLIECTDYRKPGSTKPSDLFLEVACKVRATLAGLVAAKSTSHSSDGTQTKSIAEAALKHPYRLRIALHLEQPTKPSKLFPQAVDPKTAQDKLSQLLRPVDPRAVVGNMTDFNALGLWRVK